MRVKSIQIQGLTKHTDTRLDLPETGLVVVTGDNGSGKSTLVEAVAVCRWGKSLRGTDLWSGPGEVKLETWDGATYRRRRTPSGRTTLKVEGAPEYQTALRAQREIGGDLKLWQRSCVYSFDEVVSFVRATDSERKRMLEGVLGLQRFDAAAKACAGELSEARAQVVRREADVTGAAARLEAAQQFATALQEQLTESSLSAADPADLEAQRVQLEHDVADYDAAAGRAREAAEAHQARIAELFTEHLTLKSKLAAEGHSECHACGRPFDQYRGDIVAQLTAESSALADRLTAERGVAAKVAATGRQASQDRRRAEEALAVCTAELQALAGAQAATERLAAKAQKAVDAVAGAEAEHHQALNELSAARAEVSTLEAASRVLGVKGLRAHVLSEALVGLESAVNYWLERFSPGVTCSIRPQRELKSGGTADEISVAFTGVASGHGYRGSSRGERRRQDVAVTWALGEVEAAAAGQLESTVFCDEPFDGLDADGEAALVDALTEIRERRCVVVISHSCSLVKALRPDMHYRVSDGSVARVR